MGKPQATAVARAGDAEARRSKPQAPPPGTAWLALLAALVLLPMAAGAGPMPPCWQPTCWWPPFCRQPAFLDGACGPAFVWPRGLLWPGAYAARCWCARRTCPWKLLWCWRRWWRRGALVYGWFCVRLSGVSLTMLTLAFAQITWAVCYQWDSLTGGSNGITGVAFRPVGPGRGFMAGAHPGGGRAATAPVLLAPLLRPARGRDAPLRAEAIGIDVRRVQWIGFVLAGALAAWRVRCFCWPGGISPEALAVAKSVDGLVMVLLGGVQTLAALLGAGALTWLHDTVARNTDYWRACWAPPCCCWCWPSPGAGRFCAGSVGPPQGLHERAAAAGDGPFARLWRRAGGGWRGLFAGRGRDAGPHRPQWRGQVHHLQHGGRAVAADAGDVRLAGESLVGLPPRTIWRRAWAAPSRLPKPSAL